MAGYTVIDVETTGFVPEKHDRVVEIGVVYVSHEGEIQDHWSTLVNPLRDVGPVHVHGITATDVAQAPTFSEIAPYLLRAVSGRIMVAHNAAFDLRFLAHELLRSGVPLPEGPLKGLCTMHWSTEFLNAPSRKLIDCCAACGLELVDAHSAGGDAFATAELLTHYLRCSNGRPPWGDTIAAARAYPWPQYHGAYAELRLVRRAEARGVRQDSWLDRIVSRMPRAADSRVDSYLAVLEMALLDRFLAEHEKEQLIAVAAESGLTRGAVLDIHAGYLTAMAEVALDDGVVTTTERAELDRVAGCLGLFTSDVDAALDLADRSLGERTPSTALSTAGIRLMRGDRIVFTGDMRRQRSEWEEACQLVGLVPGSVTRATRLVVAADPNSLSGKAAKARAWDIPIITEDAFETLLTSQAPALAL
jgi:DNA polymerase III subunit epsilon